MLRRRTHFIWSSLVIATCAASSILVYISLAYSGNYCKFGKVYSKDSSETAEKLEEDECIKSCSTENCILHANILQENINPAVSPCEDFYSFSCGRFIEMFPKGSDSSAFGKYSLKLKLQLKDLLDNLEEDLDTASGKMKIAYDSCMDVESSELQALSTAREFLQNVGIPNWPYLEPDFQFTKPSLSIALGISIAYKEYGFIKITNRIVRGKPVFNATVESHTSYLETNRGPTYDKAINRILKYFGLGKEGIDQIKYDIEAVNRDLNFIRIRDRDRIRLCGRGKPKDHYINCTETLESEWVTVCRILKAFVDVANITEQISTEIIIVPCMYAVYVNRVFTKIANMTHRSIANYLAMNFFLEHLDDLSFYFRLIKQKVRTPREILEDKIFPLHHWEHCVEWIVRNMHIALGYEYILKFLPQSVLPEVNDMIKEVFQQARGIVFQQNWLTDEEKVHITNRFNITTSTALQMQTYMNETFVNDSFQKFYPVRKSFLNTVLEHQRAYFSTYLVREKKYPLLFDLRPFTMNAYSDADIIEIGFGNLKFPFYLHSQSRSLNTVFLAMTVGHEIGHAITEAFEYLKNKHRSAKVNYNTRRACFEKQYSNFTIESLGVKINWEKTKDEILSDSMSIILTDLFIKKYITDEDIYVLPTLSYTVKELMYIIYSQFWCAKSSKESDMENFKTNPHPPENFRVIAVMQNSKLFSEVYHCQKEDYMNPGQKCLLMDEEET